MTATQFTTQRKTDDSDIIMELRDVGVRFGMDRGESRVLNDVSIDIERNEILGVVGESGSGKSMFASAMLDAVVEPGVTTGEITYYPESGEPVDVLDLSGSDLKEFRWEHVSMVFQGAMSSFNPVRPISTHFVETLSAHDMSIPEGMDRARELISDLYMDPDRVLDSYPHELSGGMRQRTLIALSLLLEPDMLVMDEPTAALDLLMQRSIISLIEDLKEKYDLTIVFITHDLPLIADLADRLAVLYAFEFAEIGPTDEMLSDAAHPYTRMLLKSTPNLTMGLDEMQPIEGSSPDPVNIPSGCSYHPRCPLADETCRTVDPDAYSVSEEHDVNCHHWEQADDAVPFSSEMDSDDIDTRNETLDSIDRSTDEPIVTLDDVEVHFNNDDSLLDVFNESNPVKAVDGIDLEIYQDDVIVLVGESGCGKTTLGKTGIGIQEPTMGSVEYRDQDVWQARRRMGDIDIPFREIRRALQIVHQDPGSSLNSRRRVKAILEAPLKRWHREMDSEERLDLLLGMLEYVEMTPAEDYIERYPYQLSGGEMQRVALIRAMLMNPDTILADEPVSALDVSLRVEMMDLMIELQERFSTSYLFVSHDLSNARYIAGKTGGRIAVMYLGQIVEMGSADQIIKDPRHPYTQALRWATPELDLETVRSDGPEDSPMRQIDIPDPEDPPRGCRYHTRCPNVIPPEEYDFQQETWNAVMDLKVAIERKGFDREAINSRLVDDDADEYATKELADRVRDHFGIPLELTDSAADEVLTDGIQALVDGDTSAARELFEQEFTTVCQTQSPDGIVSEDGRPVSCFLETDEYSQ